MLPMALTPAPPPPPARITKVGEPCRAHNVLAGRVILDRRTGAETLVVSDMNETTGAELLLINLADRSGKVVHAPGGSGSWALCETPGDRMIVGTFYDGRMMVFDLNRGVFTASVPFPGETYIWNLAIGKDGRVYGGTYPHGKLGALDLKSLTIEDCGAAAPPNMYLRNVSALPDGRLLCSYISEKNTERIYDPATKAFENVPVSLQGVSIGATWDGWFVAGSSVYDGKTLERVHPIPFPTPPADQGGWAVDAYMTTPEVLWLRQGNRVYRIDRADRTLELIADVPLRGGRLLAGLRSGDIAGVRGQEYFVLKRGATSVDLLPLPGTPGPRPTLFLRADPRGRLWGGPHFGQTLFHYDPATKRTVNTPTVSDSGGEVYDAAFLDGVVYAASYAGGEIIRYDPDAPWDQWNGANPKTIVRLNSRGYIRPTGGILVGPDGLLYSGWMAAYGTYGGAVAITSPSTGETKLIENPLGAQAVSGVGVTADRVLVGSSLGANGLPNQTGAWARFGVLDRTSHAVLHQQEIQGASNIRILALIGGNARAILAIDGRLCAADAPGWQVRLPEYAGAPPLTSGSVASASSDVILYGSGSSLVALNGRTGEWHTVATLPSRISNAALAANGRVYLSCDAALYEVPLSPRWRTFLGMTSIRP